MKILPISLQKLIEHHHFIDFLSFQFSQRNLKTIVYGRDCKKDYKDFCHKYFVFLGFKLLIKKNQCSHLIKLSRFFETHPFILQASTCTCNITYFRYLGNEIQLNINKKVSNWICLHMLMVMKYWMISLSKYDCKKSLNSGPQSF